MTVSTSTSKVSYQGNGATTSFPIPFRVLDPNHLVVSLRSRDRMTQIMAAGQFSVIGIGTDSATLICRDPLTGAAIAAGTTLTIRRMVPYRQDTDITNQGGFHADVLEAALDYIVMQVQQVAEAGDRALVVPDADAGLQLPAAAQRANRLLAFDGTGNAIVVDPPALPTLSAYARCYADEFLADGVTTAWPLSHNPATRANCHVFFDGVYQAKSDCDLAVDESGLAWLVVATPPAAGIKVVVEHGQALPQADIDAAMARAAASATAADAAAIRAADAAATSSAQADAARAQATTATAGAGAAQASAIDAGTRAALALAYADDAALSAWQAGQSAAEAGAKATAAASSAATATGAATTATNAATTATAAAASAGNAVAAIIGINPGQVVPAWALYDTP